MVTRDLDRQVDYWDHIGTGKPFSHPLNLERLRQWLPADPRILDFGCGYGRVLGLLYEGGYQRLLGVDQSPMMVAAARERWPAVVFDRLVSSPHLDLPDASLDAALLFAVLTCVPTNAGQRAIVAELDRVLRPGGILYISDLWLQDDDRNVQRYRRDEPQYGTYGVFELPEGVTLRHHDPDWIDELTHAFDPVALDNIQVPTMNGHSARGFQWFGLKRRSQPPVVLSS
jgi:SAM-dependent methyltransferase